jgi:hypothetical protein
VAPLAHRSRAAPPVGAERRFVEHCCKVPFEPADGRALLQLANPPNHLRGSGIVEIALQNKVASHVYTNLGHLGAEFPHQALVAEIRSSLERQFPAFISFARTQRCLAELPALARAFGEAGVTWLPLKGAAIHVLSLYPGSSPRFMRDLDLITADLPSAWRAIAVLLVRGYEIVPPLLLQRARPQGFQAIAQLRRSRAGATSLKVEVIVQPFKTTPFSNLDVDLWSDAREVEFGGERLAVPSPANLLLITAGHAFHEGALLKDANDTRLVLERFGAGIDWTALAKTAAANDLVAGLRAVAHLTLRLYGPDPYLDGLLAALRPSRADRIVAGRLIRGRGGFRVGLVWAYHEWRHRRVNPLRAVGRSLARSLLRNAWFQARCPIVLDNYIRSLEHKRMLAWARRAGDETPVFLVPLSGPPTEGSPTGPRTEEWPASTPKAKRSPVSSFLPLASSSEGDLVYVWDGRRRCLLTPAGPFFPTGQALVDDSQLEAAGELARQAAGGLESRTA